MKPSTLLLPLALALPVTSHAALLAYEGFDYNVAADGLALQNGGTGWAAAWTDTVNDGDILAGSMSYTDGSSNSLITTGNMAQMNGTTVGNAVNFRNINVSQYAGTTTLYISFIGQKILSGLGTTLDSRAVNVALFGGANPTATENISVGHGTNTPTGGFGGAYHWGAFYAGNGGNGQTPGATQTSHYSNVNVTTNAFNVLKIELNANGANDRFTLYVNPLLAGEGLNVSSITPIDNVDRGATLEAMIQSVRPFGGNQNAANGAGILNFDEFRIGTTWADVTPFVPEPGTAALAGLAGLALLRRRRA